MKKELYTAEYLMALSTNSMTDVVRSNYLKTIDTSDTKDMLKLFKKIVLTVISNTNPEGSYNTTSAIDFIRGEYESTGISSILGDFSELEQLFNKIVTIKYNGIEHSGVISLCKELLITADNSSSDIVKDGIYHSVLSILVKRNLVLKDTELSKKVVDYMNNVKSIYTDTLFYDITMSMVR